MPEAPESWGTMPLDELMALLQSTTEKLVVQHKEVALDEGAYHRKFWTHWQELPEGMTVAAMNRDCEMVCKGLAEEVTLAKSLREAHQVKQTALIAVLAARSR